MDPAQDRGRPDRPTQVPPDAFEVTLRSVLHQRADALGVPPTLRDAPAEVVAAPPRRRLGRSLGRWFRSSVGSFVAVAVAVAVVAVGGLFVVQLRPTTGGFGQGGGAALDWDTGSVRLQAGSLRIDAMGTFAGVAEPGRLTSDPGDAHYRTLEADWQEHDVPMRLYLYLAADDTHWWVSELRTYDGSPSGEWIAYTGPFFRTPLGGTYLDDIDLSSANGKVPGRLRIDDMALTAFAPGSGPADWTGCRLAGPAEDRDGDPVAAPAPAEWRFLEGMDSTQAEGVLRARGICHDYRSNQGGVRWCVPPPGMVESFSWGGDGQLIVFVDPPAGDPFVAPEAPPAGIGCRSDQRGAAPPSALDPDGPVPGSPPTTTVEADSAPDAPPVEASAAP